MSTDDCFQRGLRRKPKKLHKTEWRARLLVEQSLAVKCPSMSYHLEGKKKVQQELTKPNMIEISQEKGRHCQASEMLAGLWSLDELDIIKRAVEKPELFLMKPQREGGGPVQRIRSNILFSMIVIVVVLVFSNKFRHPLSSNNINGDDVSENLLRIIQRAGT